MQLHNLPLRNLESRANTDVEFEIKKQDRASNNT